MFDNAELNIPIAKVAEALGLKAGRTRDMYFSPMREENEASLHIDRAKNVWHDHGNGMGGTVAQLVQVTRHCSIREAYDFLRGLDPSISQGQQPRREEAEQRQPQRIKSLRDIRCYYLQKYLSDRKIPLDLARKYCKEAVLYSPQKNMHFTHVAFPNNSGGWALASPTGFKSTTKADITTINTEGKLSTKPSSPSVAVFEGFWDFLSWQVVQGCKKPSCDIVVLNSVNNIEKAKEYISAHERAGCFLDLDEAGRKCHNRVRKIMEPEGREVMDMSDLYKGHKDLNEFLQASRGYSSNMHLSPHM